MMHLDFYDDLKAHQVAWAQSHGIGDQQTEAAQARPWVLRPQFRELNLWDPRWWSFIAGKEHRWARALTSSQCFAVNLFAPLAADPALARRVLARLRPDHLLAEADTVEVALEFTPSRAPGWLGESGHATQVDAAFVVRRDGGPIGYLLVEVKLGERKLGACRGARKLVPGAPAVRRESCRSWRASWPSRRTSAGWLRLSAAPIGATCSTRAARSNSTTCPRMPHVRSRAGSTS
jgi:hypothetical protein